MLESRSIHRQNLHEAVGIALNYAQEVQNKGPSLSGLDAHYTQLAVEALQTIAQQLAKPALERDPRPTAFGAQFVRDEPNLDRRLVELVTKIEDVYRRWYRQIGQ
ncbi:MAG: hypothetical protein AABZ84_10575 [Pseudomonadota bacterium]